MKNPKITIIDYGVGNLHSLKKAFRFLNVDANISEEPAVVKNSDAIILPGVGAFEAGIKGLEVRGLINTIREEAAKNKPMLGICLGAHLMLDKGYEFGAFNGLGIIPGKVIRFPKLEGNEKIPHIDWNSVYKPSADHSWDKTIFDSLKENFNAYFIHSYILVPEKKNNIFALTSYGGYEFCSVIRNGNIYGCQFHPEKSGPTGLKLLKNFIDIIK